MPKAKKQQSADRTKPYPTYTEAKLEKVLKKIDLEERKLINTANAEGYQIPALMNPPQPLNPVTQLSNGKIIGNPFDSEYMELGYARRRAEMELENKQVARLGPKPAVSWWGEFQKTPEYQATKRAHEQRAPWATRTLFQLFGWEP
jgi:hypothetical protein